MKKIFLISAGLLLQAAAVHAAIHTETVLYKEGETVLEGYLAYDDAVQGQRPGVLVVHEWTGLGPYVKGRAEQLAALGYVAFAADIYGQGVRPTDPKEAGATASIYKNDRVLTRKRAQAGLEELKKSPLVDPQRLAAMGYCFGGMVVLELARDGADLKGVVTFHGALNTPHPDQTRGIKAKILALHGGDDPYVPPQEVAEFQKEMKDAQADWQLVSYGGAVHAFTNPEAGNDNSKGAAYNEKADKRSWEAMKAFFKEVL